MARIAHTLLVLALALHLTPARAQDAPDKPTPIVCTTPDHLNDAPDTALDLDTTTAWKFTGLHFSFDNDGSRFVKPWDNSDEHYTNGVKLEATWQPHFSPEWHDRIAPADAWPDARLAFGLLIAQHIYTPEDITLVVPSTTDRPYAGYLHAGVFLQRATDTVHDHLELDLGVVGPLALAQETQTFIHAVMPNQLKPQGWGSQLSNELAVNLRFARSWRSERAGLGPVQLDAIPRLGFDLGNVFTRANADLTFRLGLGLPDDFGPGRLLDFRDATAGSSGGWPADRVWNLYTYTRLGGRAVARNIFIDGNTFANSRSVDKEPFVGELELGLRARYKNWEFGYSLTWLTKEFETQRAGDAFGSWTVSCRF